MTNDLFPKHDEPANRDLSSQELDAVAAGFGFGSIYRFAKTVVNAIINQPISGTAGPVIIHGVRGLIRHL